MNVCPLPHRSTIRLTGDDRHAFLQGLISNDIQLCKPGHPLYAALLTPQGKFLHDLFLYDVGEDFLIECETLRVDDLIHKLGTYKLRAKISLAPEPDIAVGVGWGKECSLERVTANHAVIAAAVDPRHIALGLRFLINKTAMGEFQTAPFDDYDRQRIMLGVPDGSRDMVIAQSTLLEGNFDRFNGISWTKGCYIGQELTARMHYRALIKKRLYPVHITGTPAYIETIIYGDGQDVGNMRSHCGHVGLALLKCEIAEGKDYALSLTCGESTLTLLAK